MSLEYAMEKFFTAVYTAAVSELPLQQRLRDAYAYNIIHVDQGDVPDEVWTRLERFRHAVSHRPALGNEGTITATTSQLTSDEARTLLTEMVGIYERIAEAYYVKMNK
jgi:hypothetical protein